MVDADDRLTLDAIDTLRPPLEANPDVGYCYGLMKLIGAWSGVLRFPDFDPYILLHRSIAGAQLGLVRRRCWEDAGGFDPAIDGYEDWDFCLSALEKGWRGLQIDRGDARVPQARALGERGAPPPLSPRLPAAAREARRSLRPPRRVRPPDRPRPAPPPHLPDLLGLAPDPGAGREGAVLQGALQEPGTSA